MRSFALLLIACGVIAGAFGAHLLKDIVNPERLEVFKTGVFYQITISTVLLFLSTEKGKESAYRKLLLILLASGVIIFSASLYLLVLLDVPMFGALTPIGGSLIIISLFTFALNSQR